MLASDLKPVALAIH